MTPSGIEPATYRFVTQHLNHCATAVPVQASISVESCYVPLVSLVLRLRMSGTVPPIPLCAFGAWTETLPFLPLTFFAHFMFCLYKLSLCVAGCSLMPHDWHPVRYLLLSVQLPHLVTRISMASQGEFGFLYTEAAGHLSYESWKYIMWDAYSHVNTAKILWIAVVMA